MMFVCHRSDIDRETNSVSQLYSADLYDMSIIHVYDIDSDTWYDR